MNAFSAEEQDAQDMSRLANGHDAALSNLMERHGERLFHYLVRCLQNEEDASDLAQETFVKVYQSRTKFDFTQRFTTWLYAIATNLVKDRYRWRSRHPQISLDAENDESASNLKQALAAAEALPDQILQSEERADLVRKAVAALPDELKQALVLAVYQELPQAEIAVILNCSVKAVETRIYRARRLLKTALVEKP